MIKRILQQLAIALQVGRTFFPSILLLSFAYIFFNNFVQGKDILLTGLHSKQTSLFLVIALLFWVLITWYTSRLIAYNHDRLFQIAKRGLYHTPRVLGHFCFTVLFLSMLSLDQNLDHFYLHAVIITINLGMYFMFQQFFENINRSKDRRILKQLRNMVWLIFFVAIFLMVSCNTINTFLYLLPILQTGYLYLVITRRKISTSSSSGYGLPKEFPAGAIRKKYNQFINWVFTDPQRKKEELNKEIIIQTEKNIFLLFSLFSFLALLIYLNAIFIIDFARFISPLPILLISFGVLLGAGNILSLLSIKLQINFHFLFIASLIIIGYFVETHAIAIHKTKDNSIDYSKRITLNEKFNTWLDAKEHELKDTAVKTLPIYFVIADGGASRSAYWTASVLSTLEEASGGKFSNRIFCLSGASGGSFGNLIFYGSMNNIATQRTAAIQSYLSSDFLSFPLVRLLGPDLVIPFIPGLKAGDRARALESSMENSGKKDDLSLFMQQDVSTIVFKNKNSFNPIIAINATRMQDGAPGVISNVRLKNDLSGKRIDILGLLEKNESMNISTAVVLGARFPYFSPAGRIKDHYFVDGGYFDNSGGGIVHEMILDLQQVIMDSLRANPHHPLGKIQFNVLHISNQADAKIKIKKTHPMVNDLAAPIKTIMGSYSSQTDFNNLRLAKYLLELYPGDTTYRVINLYKKGEEDYFPMNWSISAASLKKMNERLRENQEIKAVANELMNY